MVFSYTGYETTEVQIGSSDIVDVVLAAASETLAEVVVTGLGIRKDKKALGFGVATLAQDEIAGRIDRMCPGF